MSTFLINMPVEHFQVERMEAKRQIEQPVERSHVPGRTQPAHDDQQSTDLTRFLNGMYQISQKYTAHVPEFASTLH